ncbi:PLP-dependent aminotransferase family protein [Reinekea blandensis]|uniref:Aminotransferase, putative n=1 Tax=Reinekea blandensis MED297 TaxID=314283 RepID=A4BK02_9GAMM|nr:PLP-dependent aminotransferase family protein [Reinekea blandensis]EAR07535.1 aminotransferase, putative [Reinekea sp. MED297] [Reinekea blandensis MED297]
MAPQVTRSSQLLDLAVGQPDPALLPVDQFQNCSVNASRLAYGEQTGDASFRKALASWLSEDYGQPVHADRLLLTNGSSNALDMVCTQFGRPGATVLVEDPSYFIAMDLFRERGMNVVAVPMDDEGINLAALEQAIDQYQPNFFYTVPSFHNPTGVTQPLQRRNDLVALCARTQCPIIADEIYQSLYFTQKPPRPLAMFDDDAPVVSIGSFSKILAPGLRLGWIQGTEAIVSRFGNAALLRSGGGLAPVTSALVEPLLLNGEFEQTLNRLRQIYSERADCLYHSLEAAFGEQIHMVRPDGGFFIWLSFVDGRDVSNYQEAAKQAGVNFLPGQLCSENNGFQSSMRLCFAWYSEPQLQEACNRLASVLA